MSKCTGLPSNGGMDPNSLNDSLEGEGQIMMGNTPKEISFLVKAHSVTSEMSLQWVLGPSIHREPTRNRKTNRIIFDWEISLSEVSYNGRL